MLAEPSGGPVAVTTRRVAGILGLVCTLSILAVNLLGERSSQPRAGVDPAEWGRWLADHPLTS